MGYTLSVTVTKPFDAALAATREVLAVQGFGVLTEIDLAATLQKKLGVEVAPQVILGACNPQSAYAALQAEESIGVLLPCNVVVRSVDAGTTIVEAIDPQTMHELTGNDAIQPVAERVGGMLQAALDSLGDGPLPGVTPAGLTADQMVTPRLSRKGSGSAAVYGSPTVALGG